MSNWRQSTPNSGRGHLAWRSSQGYRGGSHSHICQTRLNQDNNQFDRRQGYKEEPQSNIHLTQPNQVRVQQDNNHSENNFTANPRDLDECCGYNTSVNKGNKRGHEEVQQNKKKTIQKHFCDYCGDDWSIGQGVSYEADKVYHTDCLTVHIQKRKHALQAFLDNVATNQHVLTIGINVSFLYGTDQEDLACRKAKKKKREKKIQELLKYASAFRNSGSGHILIHFVGLEEGDSFTGAFDEFADEKLNGLIYDGQPFTDVYRKQKLSNLIKLACFNDFLVLFVERASYLTTSDFRTKLALDDRIIDPSPQNVSAFLKKRRQFDERFHEQTEVNSFEDLQTIHESRSVQLKGNFHEKDNPENIVPYWFDKLNLGEYISAFTKLEYGGSYIYGVREETVSKRHYKSQTNNIQPITIKDRAGLEASVEKRTVETLLVCDYDGNDLNVKDLVKVKFIPSQQTVEDVVVHICIRPVSGLVFYDKTGPLSYQYDGTTIQILSAKKWFETMTNTCVN